jgi:hypothetical protein
LFFFPPHCLAQLRAKTLRPAPAFLLLSPDPPQQFQFIHWRSGLAEKKGEILAVPRESTHWVWEQPPLAFRVPRQNGRKANYTMNLNQFTIIGFIGRNAETKQVPNGTSVTKFSVATTRSWKDDKGEWKDRTQWHNSRLT